MAFKYNGVTLINDSRELTNISSFDDSTTNILTSNLSAPTKSLTLYADSSARSSGTRIDGQLAYIIDSLKLQIYDSDAGEYYTIATGSFGSAPVISNLAPSYSLTDGSSTIIRITATDPDQDLLTYSVSTDSDFDAFASVTQDSSVFTLSLDDNSTTSSGIITFNVTDGINTTSNNSTISFTYVVNYADYLGTFTTTNHNYETAYGGFELTNTTGSTSIALQPAELPGYVWHRPDGKSRLAFQKSTIIELLETESDGTITNDTRTGLLQGVGSLAGSGWDSDNDHRRVLMNSYIRTIDQQPLSQLLHVDMSGTLLTDVSINQYAPFPWDSVSSSLDNLNQGMRFLTFNNTHKFWLLGASDNNMYGWKYASTTWNANADSAFSGFSVLNTSGTSTNHIPRPFWVDSETLLIGNVFNTGSCEVWKYNSSTTTMAYSHNINFSNAPQRPRYWHYANGVVFAICIRNLSGQNAFGVYTLKGNDLTNALAGTSSVTGTFDQFNTTDLVGYSHKYVPLPNGILITGWKGNDTTVDSLRNHWYIEIDAGGFASYTKKTFTSSNVGFADNATNWSITAATMASGRLLWWRYDASNQQTVNTRIDMYGDDRE